MRIGHSWDVHKLVENRDLFLGGIKIDYNLGLLGHSDADVLLHAIGESILGALGEGDLGTLFPDTDESIKGIKSTEIVMKIIDLMNKKGYMINNIDTTIYCEKPKLAPFKNDIKQSCASLLCIKEDQVNIKATTYEKMGFIGEGKAIAAEAIVLLVKK